MSAPGLNRSLAREWIAGDRPIALASLVETVGSSPLDPGSMMIVGPDGEIEGSVTGGCVEGALAELGAEVIAGSREAEVHTFGITDDEAAGVGLMCGGTVRVFLESPAGESRRLLEQVLAEAEAGREAAVATLLDGPDAGARLAIIGEEVSGGLGIDLLDRNVEQAMRGTIAEGSSTVRRFAENGAQLGSDLRVYIQAFAPPPRMIIFGAIDFSAETAAIAGRLGYRVSIVDAQAPFLDSPRFSQVAEVANQWPDSFLADQRLGARDVVLVFTHDSKFDQPALLAALLSGAGYIGALGSRRTQADRAERLRDAGVSQSEIDRIAAPCGLDLGARTPGETAVSVLAEVIARRSRRSGVPLSETAGPIHAR